jgi:hypothetical protein
MNIEREPTLNPNFIADVLGFGLSAAFDEEHNDNRYWTK